ncbi:hypothetical protein EYY60_14650 [Flavobacterium zhairuonense]|uniref:hypothetical protein n=1 Tax=Flavobacterium zhairuonense TaxID=2493631 RepID=UPI001047E66F|nr:hypothetical protein [Flavobacterium zhairuonense]KAF2508367.1 hypothetical protein EYY60_14650 [Flavobacterium zhairuonense]
MTISDLIKEVIDSSKERVKTPISGAYLLSFILWNWRPITLLLFENTTITQKIIVINSEYCDVMALIGPFLLGIFFTVGIPYIMTVIDFLLAPAKKKRLRTIYQAKNNELSEQIELVVKELELQDKRTRSKTTDDFEKEISALQNRLDTINNSNKSIVDDYENKIQDLTKILQKTISERENEKEINDFRILMINSEFHPTDFQFVKNTELTKNDVYGNSLITPKVQTFLTQKEFIEPFNNGFRITQKGISFMKFVKQTLNNNENKTSN